MGTRDALWRRVRPSLETTSRTSKGEEPWGSGEQLAALAHRLRIALESSDEPSTRDGVPVKVYFTAMVNFRLE
jgi:hypothetical protein